MKTVIVNLTQKHIDDAYNDASKALVCATCPIAQALNDVFIEKAMVYGPYAVIGKYQVTLPIKARAIIEAFDISDHDKLKPTTFEVYVDDKVELKIAA